MSKVIEFNTRDFRLDEDTRESNVGLRGFFTTSLGNEEVWEIGDWGWNWTQIKTEKTGLEKNSDYVFRFAMTGGHNDDSREVSMVHVYYYDDPVLPDAVGWENRFTYCIQMSKFQPVISKRDKTGMLRVFELPFNTGEHENWRIVIVAQHGIARFFPAKEQGAYSGLEDLSYEQWHEERMAQINAEIHTKESSGFLNLSGVRFSSQNQLERLLNLAERGAYININMQDAMLDDGFDDDEDDDEEE